MKTNEQERSNGGISRLRQLLHWATGDRAAEGKALADRAGPAVTEEEAITAVRRVHGDLGVAGPEHEAPGDVATPADAQGEHEDRAN